MWVTRERDGGGVAAIRVEEGGGDSGWRLWSGDVVAEDRGGRRLGGMWVTRERDGGGLVAIRVEEGGGGSGWRLWSGDMVAEDRGKASAVVAGGGVVDALDVVGIHGGGGGGFMVGV
ncbi:hypothetical protein Acr_22g0008890 [Actinidia rufa]|uniref:Uncharacterized protein n=1 Tax=Actinidia rufa TaxID=165716 RepID=A0A7J0GL67_9ERIC|nr:hypothetical protein Acr_22g0008890 [Actinidia rufa]